MSATESQFFREQRAKSLNGSQNGSAAWKIQPRAIMQVSDAIGRLNRDLEEGILTKLRLQRKQTLLASVAQNCFGRSDLNYQQAAKCEEFYMKNDFKLNLMDSFVRDHMNKHLVEYEKCYTGAAFESLSNVEKDREFAACHSRWIANLKGNVAFELEVKARELFNPVKPAPEDAAPAEE